MTVIYDGMTDICVQFKHVTGSTANTLLEYIQRNLPEGMAMKVTRVIDRVFLSSVVKVAVAECCQF